MNQIVENSSQTQLLPFRKCLEESANLLTVFGIFNALTIYSSTISENFLAPILQFFFFLLALIVLHETVIFFKKNCEFSLISSVFEYSLYITELLLLFYLIIEFPEGSRVLLSGISGTIVFSILITKRISVGIMKFFKLSIKTYSVICYIAGIITAILIYLFVSQTVYGLLFPQIPKKDTSNQVLNESRATQKRMDSLIIILEKHYKTDNKDSASK